MFIQNCSIKEIQEGNHFDCGDRAVLIQIVDPAYEFPVPKHKFDITLQLSFLDLENTETNEGLRQFLITDTQAQSIVEYLRLALEERRHVVVHCHAGYSRSSAITKIGVELGFINADPDRYSCPNILVESKLRFALSN